MQPYQMLDQAIRARTTLITILSDDERRVLRTLYRLAQSQGKIAKVWSVTNGWQQVDDAGNVDGGIPGTYDIAQILGDIPYDTDNDGRIIYILLDVHALLSDVLTVRALRDVRQRLVNGRKTIILLSPDMTLPRDLQKETVMIPWPLPDTEDINELLDIAINAASDRGLSSTLTSSQHETLVQALRGLTEAEIERVLRTILIAEQELGEKALSYVLAEKKQIVRKTGTLEYIDSDVTVSDIGGLDVLKQYIQERQHAFSQAAREYGLDMPRGIIIVGLPGTGKSLTAKVATGGHMPLLRCDFGALMGSLVGESERNLRAMLRLAEGMAPCVLWIDEIDKALGGAGDLDGGTSKRMLGTLLTTLQEQRNGVYVVATANDIRGLRPELIRRFDDVFWVGLPTLEERIQILNIHLNHRNRHGHDSTTIAQQLDGYTGAEIEKVVVKALYRAWSDGQRSLTDEDIIASIPNVIPITYTMGDQLGELEAWAKGRAISASSIQYKGTPVRREPTSTSRLGDLEF